MKSLRSGAVTLGLTLMVSSVGTLYAGGCSRHRGASAPDGKASDEDKALYGLGLMLGRNVQSFHLNEHELGLVQRGLADYALKKKPFYDLNKYSPLVDNLVRKRTTETAAREKAKAPELLAAAEKESGAVKDPSGFILKTTHEGTGPSPTEKDVVKVHYEARFSDGSIFDSSIARGEPTVFEVDTVIDCWTKGLERMKVGEKATLTCPPELAYGEMGRPTLIPGGAALVFDLELLSIEKALAEGAPRPSPPMPPMIPHGSSMMMGGSPHPSMANPHAGLSGHPGGPTPSGPPSRPPQAIPQFEAKR